ncbi:hypothetical protein OVA13_07330 [Pseudoxanthomonas sp. SL93]|jgi:hypothetical protein|uniref:hypothetical protein n=1 Tax=Pseudoxanthomonas sp. SL93 TaxID=2995142 RepID=UPI002270D3DE|nr:hypothetical protein [Pseudoxanthomonas sp. SL93]WAC64560.1 hypothetical protein OVA13_07330 [Pseudoxanthomonas sp. SL93]
MKRYALIGIAGSLALCSMAPAHAVEPLDRFSARIGGYITRFDTDVKADGETQEGTEVDLHRDLGLSDDDAIAFVAVTWRPWDKHEFGLAYYGNDSSASRELTRDIVFDGTVYEASATVDSEFDLDTYELDYTWWAASHEDWALGPRVGLIWYQMDLRLSAEVEADGEQVGGTISESVDADLPAPVIGADWRWTPGEDWRVSAELGYFSAKLNDIDADITYGRAGVEWFPWERVGFSLDYTINHIKADAEKDRFDGSLDFVNSGLRLGAVYRF